MADTVEDLCRQIVKAADRRTGALRFGRDLPLSLPHALEPPLTVGHDRLLCGLGAFARSEQACIVIDAGTAITVDFVDGHGVFQGGAILPGLRMMLEALHRGTAALPQISFSPDLLPRPGEPPYGKTTTRAIALGVVSAARGAAHRLIDSYAESYGAYPRVIATGGDAPLLFENDPLIDRIVPDLILMGMQTAYELAMPEDSDRDDPHER
jgi:type III pantothenate kinase